MQLKLFQNEVIHRLFYKDPNTKSNENLSPKTRRSESSVKIKNITFKEFEDNCSIKNYETSFSPYMDRVNKIPKFKN
jgi:hypothetical protein